MRRRREKAPEAGGRRAVPVRSYDPDVTIRRARREDDVPLARLAILDGTATKPAWPQLVAEAGREIRAALSLSRTARRSVIRSGRAQRS
jgi:hypothetical protein